MKGGKTRAPDSDRRRKLKKQRRKEKKRNKRDDAERDSNHAIAHCPWKPLRTKRNKLGPAKWRPEASFLPGLLLSGCFQLGASATEFPEVSLRPEEGVSFGPVLLGAICFACAFCAVCCDQDQGVRKHGRSSSESGIGSARKVGCLRKKARFKLPKKHQPASTGVPFLGGPRTAKRKHPANKPPICCNSRKA